MDAEAQALFNALVESMVDLDEAEKLFRGLIFGTDGIGKTVLTMMIAQLITPPDKTIAFIDSHNGFKVLNNPRWKKVNLAKRTKRFQFEGYSQIKTLSQLIQVKREPFANIGTVVCDELSYIVNKDIQLIHAQHKSAGKKDVDEDVPGWGEYNPAKNRYTVMMNQLLEAGVHILAVAHQREAMNRARQELIVPDFIPSIRKEILKPFDFCGHMTADIESGTENIGVQYTRRVQVHPTKLINGPKTKIDGMPLFVTADELPVYVRDWISGDIESTDETKVFSDKSAPVLDDDFEGVVID